MRLRPLAVASVTLSWITAGQAGVQLGLTAITPGATVEFTAPFTADKQRLLNAQGNSAVSEVHGTIAVPPGFDPARRWPILVIVATSDGSGRSGAWLTLYKEQALAYGWVALAADGPSRPRKDNAAFRIEVLRGALEELRRDWPASRDWPIAVAGFSGGAKTAGMVAAELMSRGERVIGLFMGGANHEFASEGLREYRPDAAKFKAMPIFISAGDADPVVSDIDEGRTQATLGSAGFHNFVLERYRGGHDLYPVHVGKALDMFQREAGR